MTAFYFGCFGEIGHHWWARIDGRLAGLRGDAAPLGTWIDGLFPPPLEAQPQGVAQLVHVEAQHHPATVLAFWDRSVDHRGGSSSTFVFTRSRLGFADAVNAARAAFPEVFARFTFPITEYRAAPSSAPVDAPDSAKETKP